jgi:hypothetical protein
MTKNYTISVWIHLNLLKTIFQINLDMKLFIGKISISIRFNSKNNCWKQKIII